MSEDWARAEEAAEGEKPMDMSSERLDWWTAFTAAGRDHEQQGG
eukprot:CAMPEP_0182498542 /NCGR_PEP_ID=MMETSP1321-20130603/6711_1 /TAXON_ID=91990 /ORGANISM="Bolidomonas sp., Strain RCC1657" /LENGTH=43 /DNA_ID= /DNA_START= /DNA_END= /DNA_ORIENTATION=